MATSKFEICSRASVRVGAKEITSFNDGTTESIVAGQEYEDLVRDELAAYRWRFATKQATLSKLVTTPADEWDYFYQIPSDMVVLQAVKVGGRTIEFDRYEDRIACNVSEGVVVDYTYRPTESLWPAYFQRVIVERMQSVFAAAVRRDTKLSEQINERVETMTLPKARSIDSQQQTTKKLKQSNLVRRRAVGA
jgi:hypothetical protein